MSKKAAFVFVLLAQAGFSAALPLVFEPNRGQTDSRVQFLARGPGATLWLTRNEAVLGTGEATLRLRFEEGNPKAKLEAEEALPGTTNYLDGKNSSPSKRDIPLFGKIRYRSMYPGIDVVFYANNNDLEYDLVLSPGADPRKIRLSYNGAKNLRVDAAGDLIFSLGSTEVHQHRPKLYQGTKAIEGHYQLLGRNRVGFSLSEYDHQRPLVIDPVLTYATILGGSVMDQAYAVATDAQGNLYVAGSASSPNFPLTGGLTTPPLLGATVEPFVAKINPSLSGPASLVWSTLLNAGTLGTFAVAVAVDPSGNVYAGGATLSSTAFVTTQGAFQTTANCQTSGNCLSGFVVKLAPAGNQLIYSTFLGGGLVDSVLGLTADAAGNAYVTGATNSPSFPISGLVYQRSLVGARNGFVSKISPDGSQLLYSSFLGGNGAEFLQAIAVDANGIVTVGGSSTSNNFPVTQNAYQTSSQGAQQSAVLSRLDLTLPGSAALLYSTYLSGQSVSISDVYALAIDSTGRIYAGGSTNDPKFPVTASAFQSTYSGSVPNDPGLTPGDGFVLRLNPATQGLAQLEYSSFLGGAGNDNVEALAIDGSGRIVIAGVTDSSNLPVTADAFECCFSNPGNSSATGNSGFLARVDPSKSGPASLLYSTYIGASAGGGASLAGVALNSAGTAATVVGELKQGNYPFPASAYQSKFPTKSANAAYVATFNLAASGPIVTSAANAASFLATGFSPGMIFTIVGSALGPTVPFGVQLTSAGAVSTLVSGTQVLVDGVPAPLLYGSPAQINAVAPYELAAKTGQTVFVQVISNGVPGNIMPVTVATTAPGIFYSAGGQGAILNQDGSVNGASNPAAKSTYISIYATGEGQTTPVGIDGSVATQPVAQLPRPGAAVSVSIGGITVPSTDIYYAGAAPQTVAGVLQVTVKIPANAASGNIPVVLTIGSQSSPKGVTVAVQ